MVSLKVVIAVLGLLALVALVWYFISHPTTDGGFVTVRDFPSLVSALQTSGSSGSFWVVLVPGTARADGYTANLQYSIEDGAVGLDWVLLAQQNIEDRERFMDYVRRAGASVQEKEANGVRYLRATGAANLIRVGQELLHGVYDVKPDDKLQLIITGFEWRKIPQCDTNHLTRRGSERRTAVRSTFEMTSPISTPSDALPHRRS